MTRRDIVNRGRRRVPTRPLVLMASAFVVAAAWPVDLCGATLSMSVKFDKSEYIIREPLRARVTLRNVSGTTARIIEVKDLGPEMRYVRMEIERTDGMTTTRVACWSGENSIRNPHYLGEPLQPGESVAFNVYPVVSRLVDGDDWCGEVTFCRPGTHRVRVVYEVPEYYAALRAKGNAYVASDFVDLTFRTADRLETEILDVLWGEPASWPYLADTVPLEHGEPHRFHRRLG